MARKSAKTTANPTQQVSEMIDTPIGLYITDEADSLGISPTELKERLASKLDNDDPLDWDVVLPEHQSALDAIRRDLECEASVRRLGEANQLPEATEPPLEPPTLEDTGESSDLTKAQESKPSSSPLTEKKTEAIESNRDAATQANKGIADTLALLQAQMGAQDAANAGTAYLTAFTANLANVKGQGLTVIAAQTLQEIAAKSNFSPNELLQQIGVPVSAETLEALNATMAQTLGKSQAATNQIVQTAWGNGYHLEDELSALDSLLNSNG